MLKDDRIEAVIDLAPNPFYGAGIPACILIVHPSKPKDYKGKLLFVDRAGPFIEGKAQNHLSDGNAATLPKIHHDSADVGGLARVVPLAEIVANNHNLNLTEEEDLDVAEEVQNLLDLQERRDAAETWMTGSLRELSYRPDGV